MSNTEPTFDSTTGEIIEAGSELVSKSDVQDSAQVEHLIANFAQATGSIYTTVQGEDIETKIAVVAAISGAEKIDDHLGEKIALKDFVIQAIEVTDTVNGQVNAATRVVLIDADGNAYAGFSKPLVSSLQLLTQLAGHPSTWMKPIDVAVEQVTTRAGFKAFNLLPWSASKAAKKAAAAKK